VHVADDLGPLAPCIAGRIAGQLAVVHDDEFAWFARYALPVAERNKLHDESKISENLWYEETLPPDTVTYTLLAERDGGSGSVEEIIKAVAGSPYCQFGGNETLGQGWFQMTVVHQSGGLANAG
jgi:CRISPR-associated protein Cmr4